MVHHWIWLACGVKSGSSQIFYPKQKREGKNMILSSLDDMINMSKWMWFGVRKKQMNVISFFKRIIRISLPSPEKK